MCESESVAPSPLVHSSTNSPYPAAEILHIERWQYGSLKSFLCSMLHGLPDLFAGSALLCAHFAHAIPNAQGLSKAELSHFSPRFNFREG